MLSGIRVAVARTNAAKEEAGNTTKRVRKVYTCSSLPPPPHFITLEAETGCYSSVYWPLQKLAKQSCCAGVKVRKGLSGLSGYLSK